jgi:hypothetical protein
MTNNIKKINKLYKEEHYKNERDNFLNELNNFLGLNDDNNTLLYNQIHSLLFAHLTTPNLSSSLYSLQTHFYEKFYFS